MAAVRRPLADSQAVHDQVYAAIRRALITGRIAPGKGVSLRSLAGELGVSPMPVRDAVRRLVAERALAINPANKRLSVPSLTADRLEQLALARLWVEPELAARAAASADVGLIRQLQAVDADLDEALRLGDVDRYMTANHAFHFTLYERAGAEVLLAMAGGLWLQIGPFMRVVFGRVGANDLAADHHAQAIAALKAKDAEGARRAIAADLSEGMDKMRAAVEGVS
ncbi:MULTISPECIES: GntR family transcriptional regulator [Caulobacter]|jgi:DNA-binding GntR family transcriptional regulator|uniref:Transcriptional regulator, GntR family n=1 Tax=Caulobacter vibrioides OR37 TaxID=1292034 RepID=R0CXX7_CAUVI|nr:MULTISPECIES: GntR family transcriptional regulator [Caulobacter]ENZ81336.1 transcriptional regulator, GntR family [Caulobacter vibrioides OR37]MBQ1561127.1 GntR family transcriptional regulator [Caulobacter sp.]